MSDVWHVEVERRRRFWRHYHLVAVAREHGDTFRLECGWAECLYLLTVRKNELPYPLFERFLFADADLDKYVQRVMRMAAHDIESRLARFDRRYKDGMLGAAIRGASRPPAGPRSFQV